MPAKKKVTKVDMSNEEIALKGIDYVNKKDAIKELETQCKDIRKPLESFLDLEGTTTSSGSKVVSIPHADVEVLLKKTLRVSKVLLPEAIDELKKAKLDDCIELVPTVREDVLESYFLKGKVSEDLLKKIYASKSTYAFSVELKERFKDE